MTPRTVTIDGTMIRVLSCFSCPLKRVDVRTWMVHCAHPKGNFEIGQARVVFPQNCPLKPEESHSKTADLQKINENRFQMMKNE